VDLLAQADRLGPKVGGSAMLVLHLPNEQGKLSQCQCQNDSIINTVVAITIVITIIIIINIIITIDYTAPSTIKTTVQYNACIMLTVLQQYTRYHRSTSANPYHQQDVNDWSLDLALPLISSKINRL